MIEKEIIVDRDSVLVIYPSGYGIRVAKMCDGSLSISMYDKQKDRYYQEISDQTVESFRFALSVMLKLAHEDKCAEAEAYILELISQFKDCCNALNIIAEKGVIA